MTGCFTLWLTLPTPLPAARTTAEGQDLLRRMLLPDPSARIQLEQIMVHPWFTTNLPPEAATMNESYLRQGLPPGAFCAWGEEGRGGVFEAPRGHRGLEVCATLVVCVTVV